MLRTLLVFTLEQWKKYKVIAYLKGMQNGVIQNSGFGFDYEML